jgi:gliding motility-associated-like protein
MNLRKHIIFVGLILAAWLTPVLSQDYLAVVCAGDTGVAYYVEGWDNSTYNWTVNGGRISRNYGDSVIVDWGDVPGSYEVTVQEVSEHGCAGELKRGIVLVSAPDIELGDDTYICEGEVFTIAPEGDYFSYEWHNGSVYPSFSTKEEGLISLTVTDSFGCSRTDELYLEVKQLPYVSLGSDTSLCGNESLVLDAGSDGIDFRWSTGDNSREITVYQGYQEIWVHVEDEFGCRSGDTLVIEECDIESYFSDIPTAITPSNPDGINDYWRVEKLEGYPEAVVDIYDRWGRLVWRSEPGYPTPWDGRDMRGREVPMDSYHFVIIPSQGSEERIVGSITVIR